MIKTIKLSDINEILQLLTEQTFDEDIKRYRSNFLYRGMPNSSYNLRTSIQRNCKDKQKDLEVSILRNFTKYAAIQDRHLPESVWRQLFIGQQHGLPTRMLDWTYSPLTALHFATSGEPLTFMDKHDALLWKIDIEELNNLLPKAYQDMLAEQKAYTFTVDMLLEQASDLDKYDQDMGDNSLVIIEPPSIDERIINQYGTFAIVPYQVKDMEAFLNAKTNNTVKYIIDKNLKWRIRDTLDQMNVNERIIYPGLDGLSTWIKRLYYVKE